MKNQGMIVLMFAMTGCTYSNVESSQNMGSLRDAARIRVLPSATPTIASSPTQFGVRVVLSDGSTTADQVSMAKKFGGSLARMNISLGNWPYVPNEYNQYVSAGFKPLLNLTWLPSSNGPVPFPTNMTEYSSKLTAVLDSIHAPELVVIENEEINPSFHSGPMSDYIMMLKTASPIVHQHGLKLTNGAVYGVWLNTLTFRYLKATYGQTFAEAQFGNYVFTPAGLNAANNPGTNPTLEAKILDVQSVLNTAPYLDYINIHYYEVENPNIVDVASVMTVTPKALKFIKEFVEATTGKPIMCNETSIRENSQPLLVTSLLQEFVDQKYPYVLWWDNSDGNKYGDSPLNDSTAPYALRPNGIAFQNFMKK